MSELTRMGQLSLFDYGALDVETRVVVQQRTEEIKTLVRRTAQDIVEIGSKLADVRDRLATGQFTEWLEAEFDWSRRTAYNFIQVAERFGRANFAQLDISASALYLLAAPSTPEGARDEALTRAEGGEAISHAAAREIVESHKPKRTCRLCGGEMDPDDTECPHCRDDGTREPEHAEPPARTFQVNPPTPLRVVPQRETAEAREPEEEEPSEPRPVPVMRPIEREEATVLIVLRVLPGDGPRAARRVMGTIGEEGQMPRAMRAGTYGALQELVEELAASYFTAEIEAQAEVLAVE